MWGEVLVMLEFDRQKKWVPFILYFTSAVVSYRCCSDYVLGFLSRFIIWGGVSNDRLKR